MRAVIGDEVRKPTLWCEFGTCIGRFTAPDALGEGELRARALVAGWRYDALGRLACPDCAQRDPGFWAGRPTWSAGEHGPALLGGVISPLGVLAGSEQFR